MTRVRTFSTEPPTDGLGEHGYEFTVDATVDFLALGGKRWVDIDEHGADALEATLVAAGVTYRKRVLVVRFAAAPRRA